MLTTCDAGLQPSYAGANIVESSESQQVLGAKALQYGAATASGPLKLNVNG